MNAVYRKLTEDEEETLSIYNDFVEDICEKYVPGADFDEAVTSKLLDEVFALWLADKSDFIEEEYVTSFYSGSDKKPTDSMIKYALGTAFGDLLNDLFGSEWMHVTDEYGEEICIRYTGAHNYTTFPYSSIEKRIASGETPFFALLEGLMGLGIEGKV